MRGAATLLIHPSTAASVNTDITVDTSTVAPDRSAPVA